MKTCKRCHKKIDRRNYCNNCRQKKWRENHKFKYYYKNKANRAKQRMVPFELTLKQFKQIWLDSGHWNDKKKKGISEYELDRINGNKGYTIDNVQIITKDQNLQKLHEHKDNYNFEPAPF